MSWQPRRSRTRQGARPRIRCSGLRLRQPVAIYGFLREAMVALPAARSRRRRIWSWWTVVAVPKEADRIRTCPNPSSPPPAAPMTPPGDAPTSASGSGFVKHLRVELSTELKLPPFDRGHTRGAPPSGSGPRNAHRHPLAVGPRCGGRTRGEATGSAPSTMRSSSSRCCRSRTPSREPSSRSSTTRRRHTATTPAARSRPKSRT